jgi:hypothetical protein
MHFLNPTEIYLGSTTSKNMLDIPSIPMIRNILSVAIRLRFRNTAPKKEKKNKELMKSKGNERFCKMKVE